MTSFENISNIAVMIVAGLVIGKNVYDRTVAPRPTSLLFTQRFMGKPLYLPGALGPSKKGTVGLFLSKSCHFCSESFDFYRRLSQSRSTTPCEVRVMALGPKDRESREELVSYLNAHAFTADGMEMVSFADLSVFATPTLVVQDASQTVRGIWVGKLSESRETEVMNAIDSLCKN